MSGKILRGRPGRDGSVRVIYPHTLPDLYAELNTRFWGGGLPPTLRTPTIFRDPPRYVMLRRVSCFLASPWRSTRKGLATCDGQHAVGIFRPPGQHWPAQIRIASPLMPDEEREVLLHEMIHCGLWFAGFPKEQHGPRFVSELERLAGAGEAWAKAAADQYREQPK
jgi:hypothetical protein